MFFRVNISTGDPINLHPVSQPHVRITLTHMKSELVSENY